jgi:hypothetical protein
VVLAIDDLGVHVNLIGLCRWLDCSGVVAARFPHPSTGWPRRRGPSIPMSASLIFEIFFKFQEQVKGTRINERRKCRIPDNVGRFPPFCNSTELGEA